MPLLGMLGNPLLKWGLVAVVVGGLFLWARAEGYRADAAGQRAAVATEAAKVNAATADKLKADAERDAVRAQALALENDRIRQEAANARATIIRIPAGPDHCRDVLRSVVGSVPDGRDRPGGPAAGPAAAGKPRVAVPARP